MYPRAIENQALNRLEEDNEDNAASGPGGGRPARQRRAAARNWAMRRRRGAMQWPLAAEAVGPQPLAHLLGVRARIPRLGMDSVRQEGGGRRTGERGGV